MSTKSQWKLGLLGFFVVVVTICFFWMWETVGASEICIVQYPNGTLEVYNTPGIHWQGFGSVHTYKKSFQYSFDKEDDKTIQVRFNDGGHGQISGSCRIDLPTDKEQMKQIHIKFSSQEGVENDLVRKVLDKAVYFTGTLMSSKESSSSRRNDLITFISDQADYGVYRTRQKEVKANEEGMDSNKIVTVVEILKDTSGKPLRQEISPFSQYHLAFGNLSINHLDYDSAVEKQIKAQQELAMQVQTSMAEAKTAEQKLYTVQKQGEANAAAAKWEQEKIKATEVTKAEQQLEVQKLATQTAELYKQQQILEGEGEAEKKRLIMNANGALDAKLAAYVAIMGEAWKAIGSYTGNWVPTYVSGGTGSGGANGAFSMMESLNVMMLKSLGLDMSIKK